MEKQNRLATLVWSTIIIWFFSEMFFQNEGAHFYAWSQKESILQVFWNLSLMLIEILLFYGFFVAWFLLAISYFRVRTLWSLTFAAAICGWAIEGSILPIMYYEMPLGLLWPAVSWHVLINVFFGWWLLRKIIETQSFKINIGIFSLLWAWWSYWATWYWPVWSSGSIEDFSLPMSPSDFTFVAWYSGIMLATGYLILGKFWNKGYNPSDRNAIIFFVIGAIITMVFSQFFSLIFFILTGIAFIFLFRNRHDEKQSNILSTIPKSAPIINYVAVLSMPLIASIVYPILYHNSISINKYIDFVLWPLIFTSLILFIISGYKILYRFKNN